MSKLTVVQELQRQLEVVSLHDWLKGNPEKFQQACLIIRTDAKVEWSSSDIARDPDHFARKLHAGLAWTEFDASVGVRVFSVGPMHELPEKAQKFIAQARQQLGYFYRPRGEEEWDKERPGIADWTFNMAWNDHKTTKRTQVIEVLTLAVSLAEQHYAEKRAQRAAKRAA